MKPFIIYDPQTGVILTSGVIDSLSLWMHPGNIMVVDEHRENYDLTHYIKDGTLTAYSFEEVLSRTQMQQGFVWKMPERIALDARTLAQAQQHSWNNVKEARCIAETSPFLFQDVLYDANVTNISGASQMALIAQGMSQPFSIEWTTRNNSVVTLNGSEMISLGIALGSRNSQVYDTARMLRVEIEAATTNQQVDAITWPS